MHIHLASPGLDSLCLVCSDVPTFWKAVPTLHQLFCFPLGAFPPGLWMWRSRFNRQPCRSPWLPSTLASSPFASLWAETGDEGAEHGVQPDLALVSPGAFSQLPDSRELKLFSWARHALPKLLFNVFYVSRWSAIVPLSSSPLIICKTRMTFKITYITGLDHQC